MVLEVDRCTIVRIDDTVFIIDIMISNFDKIRTILTIFCPAWHTVKTITYVISVSVSALVPVYAPFMVTVWTNLNRTCNISCRITSSSIYIYIYISSCVLDKGFVMFTRLASLARGSCIHYIRLDSSPSPINAFGWRSWTGLDKAGQR
jgi:hypothetical protein